MKFMIWRRFKVRPLEIGIVWKDDVPVEVLDAGVAWRFDPLGRLRLELFSRRAPWLVNDRLDVIVRSGLLGNRIEVLDLKDHERALVWIDGRLAQLLASGLYAWFVGHREVRIERFDARDVRLSHERLQRVLALPTAAAQLDSARIERDHVGVEFVDGVFRGVLGPGLYAWWRQSGEARVVSVDLRESMLDLSGQEIMTADKVTLRLNAVVVWKVVDPARAVSASDDMRQGLYREAQLALRGVVGQRPLDELLADKDAVARSLFEALAPRAAELGLEVRSTGLRDIILPGEMKELMNKVIEAQKVAEAQLIARREETAAMRSQANTAKLFADNPALMRLRELEVLERIAAEGQLRVFVGEQGLREQVTRLL